MKNYNLIIFIIIIFLQSCVTKEACLKKFPPEAYTVIIDTIVEIKTDTIYKDKVVEVKIPGKTQYDVKYIYLHDTVNNAYYRGLFESDTSINSIDYVKSWAWVNKGVLYHKTKQINKVIWIPMDSAIVMIEKEVEKIKNKNVKEITRITKNTKFANFTIWYFWISIFIITLIGVIYYYKQKLKLNGIIK